MNKTKIFFIATSPPPRLDHNLSEFCTFSEHVSTVFTYTTTLKSFNRRAVVQHF